jgi:hypothetical protein
VEERHSWLPPGLESPGLEPDDRASQRRDRKRDERSRAEPAEPKAEEPKVSRAGDEAKPPRKLRGSRDWQPLDEPEQDQAAAQRQPEKVAVAAGADTAAEERDQSDSEREQRGSSSEDGHRGSETDAMGRGKRRQVIGERYGASRTRQLLYYGIFIAFVVAVYIGGQAAVSHFDKAPKHDTVQAPWAQRGAPNAPLGGFEPRKADQKGPTRFP